MQNLRLETTAHWFAVAAVGWALVTFLFTPLVASLYTAFVRDGSIALGEISSELAQSRRVRSAIFNTIWMTAATTVTVTIVGVFQVMVLEYFHVHGRAILKVAFAIPLVFGSIVAAAGYNFTYGPSGVLTTALLQVFPNLAADWFIGWFGVLFIHTFLMTSFYFLFLRAAMRRVDFSIIEAARSHGCRGMDNSAARCAPCHPAHAFGRHAPNGLWGHRVLCGPASLGRAGLFHVEPGHPDTQFAAPTRHGSSFGAHHWNCRDGPDPAFAALRKQRLIFRRF